MGGEITIVSPGAGRAARGVVNAVDRDAGGMYDRDLDVPRRPIVAPKDPVGDYQRVLVNPMLAAASCAGAILALRLSLQWRSLVLFLGSLGWLGISSALIQVHCLDCGRTDWLLAVGRHACPSVRARWEAGRPGRWLLPSARTQVVLWIYAVASITVLLLILFVYSR